MLIFKNLNNDFSQEMNFIITKKKQKKHKNKTIQKPKNKEDKRETKKIKEKQQERTFPP